MVSIRLKRRPLIKIGVGILYTFIGLVLFLTGANIGFMPAGHYLGETLAAGTPSWVLIPIGMGGGYFIVVAGWPSMSWNKQVEEVTSGAIPQKAIGLSLSIGVAVSIGISMLRVWLHIPHLFFLVPGYLIALALTFFVPKIFTAIFFDSGGVASGPHDGHLPAPPSPWGPARPLGGDVLMDAFGVVAMVAMTPLITIQILGLFCQRKLKRTRDVTAEEELLLTDDIIDYTEEVEQMSKDGRVKLLVTIVDRDKGRAAVDIYRPQNAF